MAACLALAVPVHGQTRGLPSDLAALARLLESAPLADDSADATPSPTPGDTGRPAVGLRLALIDLDRLHRVADRDTKPALQRARQAVDEAWRRYAGGSRDLSHLDAAVDALRSAQVSLHVAYARSTAATGGDVARMPLLRDDVPDRGRGRRRHQLGAGRHALSVHGSAERIRQCLGAAIAAPGCRSSRLGSRETDDR